MEQYLRDYIDKYGQSDLKNEEQLLSYMNELGADSVETMRLIMIISSSDILDIIGRSQRVSSVALNTVLDECVESTGLSYEAVRTDIEKLLDACSKEYSFESFTFYDSKKKKHIHMESAYITSKKRSREHKSAEAYLKANDIASAYGVYLRLAKSGDAKAMYCIGMICKNQFTDYYNVGDSLGWLEAAAANGYSQARVVLGDSYYDKNGFMNLKMKKAYLNYTVPGALPVNNNMERIADIITTRKTNRQLLLVNGIIFVLAVIFVAANHISIHNGQDMLNVGIIIGLFVAALYAVGVAVYLINNFINQKILTFGMTIIWALYSLLLILN